LSIDEVNEFLNLNLKSENSDTIGGFVVELLGSIPKEGEDNTVEYGDVTFKVEKVDEKRIENLKIYIPKKISSQNCPKKIEESN
jgi:putative hemolysin